MHVINVYHALHDAILTHSVGLLHSSVMWTMHAFMYALYNIYSWITACMWTMHAFMCALYTTSLHACDQCVCLLQIELYGGLLLFCGFVLFDTQLIVEKCERGDTDYIWHSLDLFLDFINIFRRLLIILASKVLITWPVCIVMWPVCCSHVTCV